MSLWPQEINISAECECNNGRTQCGYDRHANLSSSLYRLIQSCEQRHVSMRVMGCFKEHTVSLKGAGMKKIFYLGFVEPVPSQR